MRNAETRAFAIVTGASTGIGYELANQLHPEWLTMC